MLANDSNGMSFTSVAQLVPTAKKEEVNPINGSRQAHETQTREMSKKSEQNPTSGSWQVHEMQKAAVLEKPEEAAPKPGGSKTESGAPEQELKSAANATQPPSQPAAHHTTHPPILTSKTNSPALTSWGFDKIRKSPLVRRSVLLVASAPFTSRKFMKVFSMQSV
eukprot:gnl/MRDRNA2_/MRDRNA2_462216_c0_seq1.p1 gnl/MRDRNA2_/MRDRNA2_462216_c0~~gnl/MRDRNA2_/MRDRNA2_462216_c0_seq1.p1  ORF type:complete len:173 (-),score=38.01 gnl/MRDRNA2_/MRDRNA2_462216_c0_seq1:35-529(-)